MLSNFGLRSASITVDDFIQESIKRQSVARCDESEVRPVMCEFVSIGGIADQIRCKAHEAIIFFVILKRLRRAFVNVPIRVRCDSEVLKTSMWTACGPNTSKAAVISLIL